MVHVQLTQLDPRSAAPGAQRQERSSQTYSGHEPHALLVARRNNPILLQQQQQQQSPSTTDTEMYNSSQGSFIWPTTTTNICDIEFYRSDSQQQQQQLSTISESVSSYIEMNPKNLQSSNEHRSSSPDSGYVQATTQHEISVSDVSDSSGYIQIKPIQQQLSNSTSDGSSYVDMRPMP